MTSDETKRVIAVLVIGFPKGDWSDAYQRLFAERIGDLEVEPAKRAAALLLETQTFAPSIAEFRKAYVEQVAGPRRLPAEAWADVVLEIRREGYCGKPHFRDPITRYVVERMGWTFLCTTDCPDGVLEKRFADFYEGVQDNERLVLQLSDVARPKAITAGGALRALPSGDTRAVELAAKIAGIGAGGR